MEKKKSCYCPLQGREVVQGVHYDFTPLADVFHLTSELEQDKGTIYDVNVVDLKAVFFVMTLHGSSTYREKKRFEEVDTSRHRGLEIKVLFKDGEVVRGMNLHYSKEKEGFFLIPVDPESKNERIWAFMNAVQEIKVSGAAVR